MKYDLGLYIGRFQPFHKGHEYVIKEALKDCKRLLIVIGSSQESNTSKNPLSYELRKEMIEVVTKDLANVTIIGVKDRVHKKDDSSWGEYLLNEIKKQINEVPEVMFSGTEEVRADWFTTSKMDVVSIDRNIEPISATLLREAILKGDKDTYKKWCFTGGLKYFEKVKEILEKC